MKHRGVPDDLVGLVVYLASDASHYVTGQVIAHDGGWDARGGVDGPSMPEFVVEFGKDGAAAGGRPARRRGVPPQSRSDRAGARSLSAGPHRRRAGDRLRHRPARRRVCQPDCRRSPGGRPISTTIICAASRPGGRMRSSTTCRPPVRLDASAPDWRLPALGLPRSSSRYSAPTSSTSRRGRWRKACSPAPAAICAPAAGCSSTARSSATASTTRRATPRSTKACAAENPEWGVRDTADLRALARANGLRFVELVEMPSNNAIPDVRALAAWINPA